MTLFGASHLVRGVSTLDVPEADPNVVEPPGDRVFRSPPSASPIAAFAWLELADGASTAEMELWLRTDRSWRLLGSFFVNEPGLSSDVPVPPEGDLFARVLSVIASRDALLAVGFRPAPPLTAVSLSSGGLLVTAPPLVGDPGFPVYVTGPIEVTSFGGVSTVTAGLGPTDEGLPFRTIEEAGRIPVILGLGGEGGDQPLGTVLAPLFVKGSDGTDPQQFALEHARPDDPHAVRLTDGADFYDARQTRALTSADVVTAEDGGGSLTVDTLQLPGALESSRLATSLGLGGSALSVSNPAPVRQSDGSSFYVGAKTGQLPAALGPQAPAASLSVLGAVGSVLTTPAAFSVSTAASLASNSFPNGFVLQASYLNTDAVWVSASPAVIGKGVALLPGDWIRYPLSNTSQVAAVAASGTQSLTATGVTT